MATSNNFSSFDSWPSSESSGRLLQDTPSAVIEEAERGSFVGLLGFLGFLLGSPFIDDMSFPENSAPVFERALGRGASFTVRRANQGKRDQRAEHQHVLKGGRAGVAKNLRITALAREASVLSHPALHLHPNIVRLRGVAWERDEDGAETVLPMLALELAAHGNLGAFLNHKTLPLEQRISLCFGVASGLRSLHRLDIAHCDIKCENVIISPHSESGYIAKLTDFGFAEVCKGIHERRLGKGSVPWNAPEWLDIVNDRVFLKSDIYSFGLLLWRCILGGQNPFELHPYCNLPAAERNQLVEERKRDGQVLGDAISSLDAVQGAGQSLRDALSHLLQVSPEKRALDSCMTLMLPQSELSGLDAEDDLPLTYQIGRQMLVDVLVPSSDPFRATHTAGAFATDSQINQEINSIGSALRDHLDNEELQQVIDQLKAVTVSWSADGRDEGYTESTLEGPTLHEGWIDPLAHVLPMVKRGIFTELLESSRNTLASSQERRSAVLEQLSICYISEFGTPRNAASAMEALAASAKLGSVAAQAIIKRFGDALALSMAADLPILQWLVAGAESGSLIALEDLEQVDPAAHQAALQKLRRRFCGLGRQIFSDHILDLVCDGRIADLIAELGGRVQRLNSRGDGLVHCLASSAPPASLEEFLREFPKSIHEKNLDGETPLYFACRSGNADNTRVLLKAGADASARTSSGATPMHWLSSFDAAETETIARELLFAGGTALLWVVADRDKSCFPHYYNGLGEGIPLHRAAQRRHAAATRILLELGSSATVGWGPRYHMWRTSAFGFACASHDSELIRLFIESKKLTHGYIGLKRRDVPRLKSSELLCHLLLLEYDTVETWLSRAFSNSSLFLALSPFDIHRRLCIHGPRYKARMTETVDILLAAGASLSEIATDGQTGLFAAVQGSDADIVDKVLSLEGAKHLYTPCTELERIPLQQAMFQDSKDVFFKLLDLGPVPLGAAPDGNTMIQTYASTCPVDTLFLDALVDRGCLTSGAPSSLSAFVVAVNNKCFALALDLLRRGADVNEGMSSPRHATALQLVLSSSEYSLHGPLHFLLHLPPEHDHLEWLVAQEDGETTTILHFACFATKHFERNNAERVFSALLEKPAAAHYLEWLDESGVRPLGAAIFCRNLPAVRCLLAAGAKPNYLEGPTGGEEQVGMQPLDILQMQVLLTMAGGASETEEDEDVGEEERLSDPSVHSPDSQAGPNHEQIQGFDAELDVPSGSEEYDSDRVARDDMWEFLTGEHEQERSLAVLTEIYECLREFGAKTAEELAGNTD